MEKVNYGDNNEKKFYATINLFNLIITGIITEKDINAFYLMDGNNKLNSLGRDVEEGLIDLNETIGMTFEEMQKLKKQLDVVTVSKSFSLNKGFNEFQLINNYFVDEYKMVLESIASTTIKETLKQVLPKEVDKIVYNSKKKTKGEI